MENQIIDYYNNFPTGVNVIKELKIIDLMIKKSTIIIYLICRNLWKKIRFKKN